MANTEQTDAISEMKPKTFKKFKGKEKEIKMTTMISETEETKSKVGVKRPKSNEV